MERGEGGESSLSLTPGGGGGGGRDGDEDYDDNSCGGDVEAATTTTTATTRHEGGEEDRERSVVSTALTSAHLLGATTATTATTTTRHDEGGEEDRDGWVGECQPPTKPSFVPKPPKRRRKGKLKRAKKSTYDWQSSRDALGLGHDVHPRTVYAAATASTGNAVAASTTINSPSKEEVKAENQKLKMQTHTLERKVGTTKRKVDCIQTQVKSLSDALKVERIKSRVAIENLLLVTATEHETLLETFHDNIVDMEREHNSSICKITRDSNNMVNENEKGINKLMRKHAKEIETLSRKFYYFYYYYFYRLQEGMGW